MLKGATTIHQQQVHQELLQLNCVIQREKRCCVSLHGRILLWHPATAMSVNLFETTMILSLINHTRSATGSDWGDLKPLTSLNKYVVVTGANSSSRNYLDNTKHWIRSKCTSFSENWDFHLFLNATERHDEQHKAKASDCWTEACFSSEMNWNWSFWTWTPVMQTAAWFESNEVRR